MRGLRTGPAGPGLVDLAAAGAGHVSRSPSSCWQRFHGYWVHRWVFPYARPDRFLTSEGLVMVNHKRVFAAALICRAIVVGCAMLAVGMGL